MSDEEPGIVTRREFIQASAVTLVAANTTLAAAAPATTTVASYLVTRLSQHGAGLLFGVPGATCDPLFAAADAKDSGMQLVVTSSDLEAGYAVDGYARFRGLGAVAVTYGVGTMGLLSVIGGAFVERSPVVVINGGPSTEDLRLQRDYGTTFSHSIGRDQTDLAVFREVTAFAQRAETAQDVPRLCDAALRVALTQKRPVYLEIPKHLWDARCPVAGAPLDLTTGPTGQEPRLAADIAAALKGAKKPALLLGIELQRCGLTKQALALVAQLGVPWGTTLLAKSVIPEQTPGFVGVYAGGHSVPAVKRVFEGADALVTLGCVLGRQYRGLITRPARTLITVLDGAVRINRKPPVKATLEPLLAALMKQPNEGRTLPASIGLSFDERRSSLPATEARASAAQPGLTYDGTMRTVSGVLDDSLLVITDTSLSMYPAAELNVSGAGGFVCNGVWQAIGFSVGAAVGAALAQRRKALVLCGDGGFQMTAQSLSTMAARKLGCIVVVFDNGHYGIEQWLLDPKYFASDTSQPRAYLGLNRWDYPGFARALGFEHARAVETEGDLKAALVAAKTASGPTLISARIQRRDLPSQLKRS